ncbi:hypothetical protein F5148DRAFT_974774 [Russula earlei]|uniref:Uncharacterized protein n=1 Tax=Russula earlei TaxID=71964 RepID=A0ACC0UK53_9AGAM|nr:hypothetical protein F5148DRAFT_974774 [Russula earlei]
MTEEKGTVVSTRRSNYPVRSVCFSATWWLRFQHINQPLATISQKIAYLGIKEHQPPIPHLSTTKNLQTARLAIADFNDALETDNTIWMGIRKKSIRTHIQQFLYKSMHSTHRIGPQWRHIPNYEDRKFCSTCNIPKSMDHILIYCEATPCNTIWSLAKETWPHAPHLWRDINLGTILGCGCLTFPNQDIEQHHDQNRHRRIPKGATRLLQILISEAAHLIWVIRCERVIQDHTHQESETHTRWFHAINTRLTNDKIIATLIKQDKRAFKLVRDTWEPVLRKTMDLPNDWIFNREVLVGRRLW